MRRNTSSTQPSSTDQHIAETIDAKRRMAGQHIKIAVAMKHRCVHANRNRSDETVNQLADGLSR